MMQVGKLVKVYVYIKGKRIEVEPDEARALLAQLKAALGEPSQQVLPKYIPFAIPQWSVHPQPAFVPADPYWPGPIVTCTGQDTHATG